MYKNKSYISPPEPRLYRVTLSLHGGEAVAVRFVAVGLAVVQCLQLLSGSPLVSVRLFPNELFAVVEQVTWQQEASQWEDQQAEVDLREDRGEKLRLQLHVTDPGGCKSSFCQWAWW